jgi:hypothetical protein
MGKASSNKKVARAASTGGSRTTRSRQPWGYSLVILLAVVLGTAGVVSSRNHRLHGITVGGQTPPRAGVDHWHVAYGLYACDHFLNPITDQVDPVGIHTHGDGVIHVHPFVNSSAGKNAVLGKFASTVHMTLNSGELKAPGGHDYRDGDKCNGKPGRVEVQIFNSQADPTGHLATVDPSRIPLVNLQLLTIAFVPKGTTLPPPPSAPVLNNLSDVTKTTPTTTAPATGPATTTPTTAATPASTTATTAKK